MILLVLIVGVSYALWQSTRVQEDTNIIASGCFGVTIEGNEGINLANTFPITTEDGMKTKPYTFTITNTCSEAAIYDINLESLSSTTHQNESIRVALDDTNKLYSEYPETEKYYSTSKDSRKLTSGSLASGDSITYNLRIWIDEIVTNSEQNKTFVSKIVVTSSEAIEPTIENLNATSTLDTINITYQTNGDITPAICKWGITVGEYDNVVADATSTNCNITGLTDGTTYYYQICTETGKGSKCVDGNIKTIRNALADNVELGDYISMTPTSTSYTPTAEDTGCVNKRGCTQNTINPSELNLWRVIKKNDDGTVEMVSEYVSSETIYFMGASGYMNLVGTLNTIAAQYTNEKYVQSTRHIGYSGQVFTCTSLENCPGDTGYETDTNLVQAAIGTLVGKNPLETVTKYWMSSRRRNHYTSETAYAAAYSSSSSVFYESLCFTYNDGSVGDRFYAHAVRPIITLKSTVEIKSGDGESADTAYQLA